MLNQYTKERKLEDMLHFIERSKGLTREEFLAEFKDPQLLTSRKTLEMLQNPDEVASMPQEANFVTMLDNFEDFNVLKMWMPRGWYMSVVSQREGEMQMVNVGRTSNNDILIPLPLISKFHCCFMIYSRDKSFLIEGGSTNGTYVNGKQLEPNEKIAIKSGDIIQLGQALEFEFFFPEDLYPHLNSFRMACEGLT